MRCDRCTANTQRGILLCERHGEVQNRHGGGDGEHKGASAGSRVLGVERTVRLAHTNDDDHSVATGEGPEAEGKSEDVCTRTTYEKCGTVKG